MSITLTHLTTGSDSTDGGPFVTASVSPTAGKFYTCTIVLVGTNPAPYVGSVTGLGLTWQNVATITGNGVRTSQIYAAVGTPSSGAVTITQGAGNTATAAGWTVAELAGVDLSGGVAGAIVQTIAARITSATINQPFTNTVNTANATLAVTAGPEVVTPTSPWTLTGGTTWTSPAGGITTQFAGTAQQNIQATASSSVSLIPVGIEIKAATSTTLLSETFESGSNGTTITTANSAFNNLVQAGWTFSNEHLLASGGGSLAGKVATTSATSQANGNFAAATNVAYVQWYMYVASLPSTNSSILQLTSAGTLRGEVRLNTDGAMAFRNSASAAVATSSSGLVSAAAWFRCRYLWNNSTGQAQLQVFTGSALHGTTPTYDSGLLTATTGGTADRLHIGVLNSQTATWYFDNVNADGAAFAAPTGTPSSNLDKLKLGTNLVGLRVGTSTPTKVYLGTTQVWP